MDMEKTPNKNRRIKWDQQKLKQTEKDRGIYQKIDQPKTPYQKNSQDSQQQVDIEPKRTFEQQEVEESLQKAKKNKQINRKGKIDLAALNAQIKQEMIKYDISVEKEDQEEEEQSKKKQEFNKKRAEHYNDEFKKAIQVKNHWKEDNDS